MTVGSLFGSMTLDLSVKLSLLVSYLMPTLPVGQPSLDQSIPASSRAVSLSQMTRNQVDHPRGDHLGSLVTPLSFFPSSLKDHQKTNHTDFGTIEGQAMPW